MGEGVSGGRGQSPCPPVLDGDSFPVGNNSMPPVASPRLGTSGCDYPGRIEFDKKPNLAEFFFRCTHLACLWYTVNHEEDERIEHCRCYHLMSRLYPPAVRLLAKRGAMRGAHRAFFLDEEENTRAVELLRRVEEFCGVMVLAYAIMSNHFHIFIFVPEPEEIDDEKARLRVHVRQRGRLGRDPRQP